MIQVRKVQPKDIEYLLREGDKLSFDSAFMLDKLESMMVVINGGKLCGIGCGITVEDNCLLNWIFVAEEFRRDRMGTALLKTILNNAELSGAKTACLSGSCDEFAGFLKFSKVYEEHEVLELEKLYKGAYDEHYQHNFYKADLTDYFKPCCGK